MEMKNVLGMNARNFKYTSVYNKKSGKKIADSKLLTKSTLRKHKLPSPRLFKVFRNERDLVAFDFSKLPQSFVVKPNRGLGGEGIIVVEKAHENEGEWVTAQGEVVGVRDLKLHVQDVLEGRFSMHDMPDIAYIEERVLIHPVFEKYAYHGTPDIGILIFNKIPVMAFLRLPTKESGGRANMFQGALACGIDIGSGITTHAVQHSEEVTFFPGTKRKLRGIVIPEWEKIMEIAIRAAEVTGLGYMRADIVLQPSYGEDGELTRTSPKVLELNAQPGLKIQLANKAGLQDRLERVKGLEVDTPDKGIRIAKELFGDKSIAHMGKKIKTIGVFETVEVVNQLGDRVEIQAKVDTGADRSSIDRTVAEKLGLLREDNFLYERSYRSSLGRERRQVVGLVFYLHGRRVETSANVVDRSHLKRAMLVGRRDLKGFVVGF